MNIDVIIDERLLKQASGSAPAPAQPLAPSDSPLSSEESAMKISGTIRDNEGCDTDSERERQQQLLNMCRICHSDANVKDMIVPCKCSGSLKYVHQSCLQNWVKISGSKSCEICKDEFIIKVRANSLSRWKKPLMSRDQKRKFMLMNFLYLVAILCNLWSINSFSGVLLMQFRMSIFDWKFYMIVFFSMSTFFCIIWFMISLIQIWIDFLIKCVRHNQSIVIRSKF